MNLVPYEGIQHQEIGQHDAKLFVGLLGRLPVELIMHDTPEQFAAGQPLEGRDIVVTQSAKYAKDETKYTVAKVEEFKVDPRTGLTNQEPAVVHWSFEAQPPGVALPDAPLEVNYHFEVARDAATRMLRPYYGEAYESDRNAVRPSMAFLNDNEIRPSVLPVFFALGRSGKMRARTESEMAAVKAEIFDTEAAVPYEMRLTNERLSAIVPQIVALTPEDRIS